MYKLITYNGEISERKRMSLKQMQDFVGGYTEYVGRIICNEDGLRLKLPRNVADPRFVGNVIMEVK